MIAAGVGAGVGSYNFGTSAESESEKVTPATSDESRSVGVDSDRSLNKFRNEEWSRT